MLSAVQHAWYWGFERYPNMPCQLACTLLRPPVSDTKRLLLRMLASSGMVAAWQIGSPLATHRTFHTFFWTCDAGDAVLLVMYSGTKDWLRVIVVRHHCTVPRVNNYERQQ